MSSLMGFDLRNNQISDLDSLSNMKNTTTKYVDMRFNEMNISEDSWDLTIIE